jgi:hypothetical protein
LHSFNFSKSSPHVSKIEKKLYHNYIKNHTVSVQSSS